MSFNSPYANRYQSNNNSNNNNNNTNNTSYPMPTEYHADGGSAAYYQQPYNDPPGYQQGGYSTNAPDIPPSPPRHRQIPSPSQRQSPPRSVQHQQNYNTQYNNQQNWQDPSLTTPGSDNLSERAPGGGISGVAMGVAGTNERASGARALHDLGNWGRPAGADASGPVPSAPAERYQDVDVGSPYNSSTSHSRAPSDHQQHSFSSTAPLAAGATIPGFNGAGMSYHNYSSSGQSTPSGYPGAGYGHYSESPYNRFSSSRSQLGIIDPMEIADDGDDPMYSRDQRRKSVLGLPLNGSRSVSRTQSNGPAAGAGAAVGAGAAAAGASVLSSTGSRDGPKYGPVPAVSGVDEMSEKAQWLEKQRRTKKRRWIVIIIIAIIVAAAIAGGVAGGVLAGGGGGDSSESERQGISAEEDDAKGDLEVESQEIRELMDNPDLHRVFPGIDYTPINSQYPDCLTNPPSQNNVTRDMAVLAQMTNTLRLYGTDCNQTEMVIHAIDRLKIDDMKVWLGVWLGKNETTNTRQLKQMDTILDTYGADPFAGVVVGNEVLYREDLTMAELAEVLEDVRDTLDEKNIDLPLATSDLGDNWDATLAETVDVIMANVHPFFSGVSADKAAGWTWTFWQNNNIPLTAGMSGKEHVVSEVGWPSEGGNNCGDRKCTTEKEGSVASIEGMNTLMEDWVCESLKNGTDYFW